MTKRFSIVLGNDLGGRASSAIAETVGGDVVSTTQSYDGENDLALIDVPEENSDYMEEVLDGDDNVISYR